MLLNYRIRKHLFKVILYIAAALLMVYMIGPIIWIIITSFQPSENLQSVPPQVTLTRPTLIYYEQLFASPEFVKSLTNTIIITTVATALAIGISCLGAYAVALQSATSQTVESCWVHLPLAGSVVEISI